jgi:energy-coupling factor transporter transmembrane protein EcfT
VVLNTLRQADDIVNAAEARAFSAARTRPMPLEHGRYDYPLLGALALACALLVWW